MITAREIAQMVGVSVSTVGRAMADDPRISAETRTKVQRAAARVGYVGNLPARIVRGGNSNLIGLLVPEVSNDFYATIAQALSEVCNKEGFRLVLSLTGDEKEGETRHIRELVGARAAGIIVVPTTAPHKSSVQLLRNIPHVQLLRRVSSLGDIWFGIDDSQALEQAVAHLASLGHERIAYIGGTVALSTGEARLRGFEQGCEKAGITPGNAISAVGTPTRAFGAKAFRDILKSSSPPTAIISGAVNITLGVIETVEEMDIPVPSQFSLIGFGDPEWFQWWRGGLTTIRPPVDNLATSCGLWFLNQLRDEAHRKEQLPAHNAVVNSSLIIRKTTRQVRRGR
ncbi:LacI family DNA-binding transcriptional regulator [Novosphingobium sp.]|uniref:LacI family DNA-binding transcriptional regulator n=1 Tax=Novosphingobium sp. TaxID=1874826 RepID=UPI002B4797E9|nr:LacI family DNA-binding transcriptional regulator [Novosphingobium sp.]HKR93490.1 LacI family DNA-binding transcriptional regulator [Novosphingobium sp.]